MVSRRPRNNATHDTLKREIARQQTHPYPSVLSTPHTILTTPTPVEADTQVSAINGQGKKGPRIIAMLVIGAIGLVLYFVWKPATPVPQAAANIQLTAASKTLTTLTPLTTPNAADGISNAGGEIQVYVIGAVQHAGVYTLANNARVYQLLQAAGGALSSANLAVINMAARLSDGQEIYVPRIGETPIAAMSGSANGSTNQAALLNINSASVEQLRQGLHLSSKSAQQIVDYRLQHGAFSSVDALAQVVSKIVYDKIKDKVTI
ncbi:MAG: hypothetical protein NVS2B12_25810 [Ktedonobacteraceae bacterium]